MASLFNTKISNTYVGLIKTIDNAVITATLKELTDGSGNATGLSINTGGDFKASGTIEWGSLKDTGENITITKFVDEADGIANNDNDTTIPTSAAIVDYVAARITLEDLDFSGDSGTGSVDLDSQVFAITGTANQIETTASGQGLSFAFPSAGIVLPNGSTATTQSAGDNSTKIATTAYVETAVDTVDTLAEILAIGNTTGATKISIDNTSSGIDLIDDAKIRLGTGNDFEIYHDGSHSYIKDVGTGNLQIETNDLIIKSPSATETLASFATNGAVELYFNDNKKLETTSEGATITGGLTATGSSVFTGATFSSNVDWADNAKARFGTGNDLEIYHDGSDSYIDETGTGDLIIQGSYLTLKANGSNSIVAHDNGTVYLYHSGSTKLSTTSTGIAVTGGITTDGASTFSSSLDVTGAITADGGLNLNDNDKIKLGTTQDLEIYHDGSDSYIDEGGTGGLKLESNSFIDLQTSNGGAFTGRFINGGAVELYHNGTKKLETTSTGISVTGVAVTDGLDMGDDEKIRLGDSQDLEIYHDSSNTFIENNSGYLMLRSDTAIYLRSATGNEQYISCAKDGEVSIYYDDVVKFETTGTGVSVTGVAVADGFQVGDDENIELGDSQELKLTHTGSGNSIITHSSGAAGDLYIDAGSTLYIRKDASGGESMIKAIADGAVELYYNNSKKLETTSTGVSVTGNVVASGDGSFAGGDITIGGSAAKISGTSGGQVSVNYNTTSNQPFIFYGGGSSEQFKVTNTGDVTVAGSTTITGDLTVNGTTTTVNTETLAVEDPLISMAKDNSANSVDIGFYGRYNDGSNRYLGLFSDASDSNKFKLFKGTTTEPTTTVDTGATGYEYADILLNNIEARGTNTIFGASGASNTGIEFGSNQVKIRPKGSLANGRIYRDGDQLIFDSPTNGHIFAVAGSSSSNVALEIDSNRIPTFTNGTSSGTAMYIHNYTDAIADTKTLIDFRVQASDNAPYYVGGQMGSKAEGTWTSTSGSRNGSLIFNTVTSGNNVTALTLDSSQNATLAGNLTLLSRLTFDYNGSGTGNNYLETGTNTLSFKSSTGTSIIQTNFSTADTSFAGNINLIDSKYVYWGASNDFYIGHTGSETNLINSTGSLNIEQHTADGNMVFKADDGSGSGVATYFTLDGGSAATNEYYTKWPDNSRIALGTGKDLQIYHDGSNSYIKDGGTGDLRIWADSPNISTASGNKIFFGNNGAAELYYTGGAKKFETTSSGVEILSGNSGGDAALDAPILRISNTTESSDWDVDDVVGSIEYYSLDESGNAPYVTSFIKSINTTGNGTLPDGALSFGTASYNASGGAIERARIDASGRLLVGSTSHSISSAQKFEVNCNSGGIAAIVGDSDTIAPLYVTNTGTTTDNLNPHILFQDNAGNRALMGIDYTQTHLFMNGHSGIDFYTNMSTPVKKLEISSTAGITVNGDSSINRGDQNSGELLLGGTSNGGFVDFDSTNLQLNTQRDPNTGTWINTGKSHAHIGLQGADGGSSIIFGTASANNTTATTRMTINPDGFIGIGGAPVASRTVSIYNTSANNELEFIGTDYTNIYSNTESGFDIGTVSTAGASYLRFLTENAMAMKIDHNGMVTIGGGGVANTRLVARGSTNDSSAHALEAANNSGASMFLVRNDGKVAIGTSAANYTFAVYGDLATFGTVLQNVSATGNGLLVDSTDGTNSYVAGGFRTNAGVYKCVIYGNGDIANVNNSYGTYSDIKLKENIKDATPKLEDICKLKVRNFDLKETKENQIGFVAQELEKVFPSLVYETDDTIDGEDGLIEKTGEKTKAIKSSVLVPMLVKAVQELKAEVDELKKNCNCK